MPVRDCSDAKGASLFSIMPPPLGSNLKNQELQRENFQIEAGCPGGFKEGGTARLKHRLTAGSITRLHTLRDETTDPHELGGFAVLRSHFVALRRGRSTNSVASSASLRSVLRGVPICARMVSPRAKSVI